MQSSRYSIAVILLNFCWRRCPPSWLSPAAPVTPELDSTRNSHPHPHMRPHLQGPVYSTPPPAGGLHGAQQGQPPGKHLLCFETCALQHRPQILPDDDFIHDSANKPHSKEDAGKRGLRIRIRSRSCSVWWESSLPCTQPLLHLSGMATPWYKETAVPAFLYKGPSTFAAL